MGIKCLIFCMNLGLFIIVNVENTEAYYNSPQLHPIPLDISEIPAKLPKMNMYKSRDLSSVERQYSSHNKPKSSYSGLDLKTNGKYNFNPEMNINLHNEHHGSSPVNKNTAQLQSPMLHGRELEENFKQNLHQSVNNHLQNLQHASVNSNENLHKSLTEHNNQNTKNFIQNKEQLTNIPRPTPDVKVKYPQDENIYDHNKSSGLNGNANKLPSNRPLSHQSTYGQTKSHHSHDPHGIPMYNNGVGHQKVSLKYEEPNKGIKSQTYSSDEYYYEDHKVKQLENPSLNEQQSYDSGSNAGSYNTGYPPSQKITFVDKNIPGQYDLGSYIPSDIGTNKNHFNSMPHQTTGMYNSYNPPSYSSGYGNVNKNFDSVYSHSPVEVPFGSMSPHSQGYMPHKNSEHTISTYFHNHNPSNMHKPQSSKEEYPNSNEGNENEYSSIPSQGYSQNPDSGIKNTKYPQAYAPVLETGGKEGVNEHSYGSNKNYGNNQHHHTPSVGITYDQDYSKEKGYNGYGSSEENDEYKNDSPVDSKKRHPTPVLHGLDKYGKNNQKNTHTNQIKGNFGAYSPHSPNSQVDSGNKQAFVTPTKSVSSSYGQNDHASLSFNNAKDSEGYNSPNNGLKSNLGSKEMPNLHSQGTPLNKYTSPMKTEGFKFNDAPIVHQIYMSDPLLKSSDFFPSELTVF